MTKEKLDWDLCSIAMKAENFLRQGKTDLHLIILLKYSDVQLGSEKYV